MLCRLMYISENHLNLSNGSVVKQLSNILSTSNRNNERLGLTGALIFDDTWFVQALEGEREVVWDKFRKICDDERHAGVVLAEMRDIDERRFGNWWMGLAARSKATDSVFQLFERDKLFRPLEMAADEIMQLIMKLSEIGLDRDMSTT